MANKNPYYTSETLISAVRRRCSLPKSDSLFSDLDILEFANDELMESILPMIKGTHEEYFVWNETQEVQSNQDRYVIPERAIGNALRDLSFIDEQDNEYEMTRILRDDRYTTQFPSTYSQPYRFYVENASIVLVPEVPESATGSLQLSYLLRPNNLVLSEDVAKVVSTEIGFVSITVINTGLVTTITTASPHELENGEEVEISNVSGTGNAEVNGVHTVTVTGSTTFTINVDSSALGPLVSGVVYNNTTRIKLDNIPNDFSVSTPLDILKTRSPHNTLAIDVYARSVVLTNNTIVLKDSDVPRLLSQGDTIALANETDIPGIPTELHRLLISKVCERIMEAIGDTQGIAAMARHSQQSENAAGNLIENRVTSAPLKVRNTSGFLNRKYRRTRRF